MNNRDRDWKNILHLVNKLHETQKEWHLKIWESGLTKAIDIYIYMVTLEIHNIKSNPIPQHHFYEP